MYNQIIGSLSFKLRIFLDSDHLDSFIPRIYRDTLYLIILKRMILIREKFEGMPEILNPPNNNNSVEAQSSQIRA